MTGPLRLGLAGTGYWADVTHATAATAAPAWELKAVWASWGRSVSQAQCVSSCPLGVRRSVWRKSACCTGRGPFRGEWSSA